MNRPKGIWLFPFFNIMICAIGVLLLIGATMVGFSIDADGIVTTNTVLQSINEKNASSPIFIEWDGQKLVTHPSMSVLKLYIPHFELDSNINIDKVVSEIGRQIDGSYLQRVIKFALQSGGQRYFVVLVRPSGFDNFIYIREFILKQGLWLGYEPIGQYWILEPSGKACF